jgi:hypothetical protein
MPYQVDFDTNNRILRARFLGRVTDDELGDVYRFGQEHVARFDPLSGITDFSSVTAVASLHRQCVTSPASSPLCRIRAGRSSSSHRRLISLGCGDVRVAGSRHAPKLARRAHGADEAYAILNVLDPQFAPV